MRLTIFNDNRLGIVDDDYVIDVSDLVADHCRGGALAGWIRMAEAGGLPKESAVDACQRLSLDDVTLACPLPAPGKVIAAPVNYLNHKSEMNVEHTVADLGVFLKAPTSIIGPGDTVQLPYSDQRFDQEGELGVVIGSHGRNLSYDEAWSAVFGYTCVLDISLRSSEDRSTRKSFDTFTPVGPWVVTADEIPKPEKLQLRCWVNDTLRQDASISELIFDVPMLIAYASSIMTLEPGDIIATGTPAGVGRLNGGDTIVVDITDVGRLSVTVSADHAMPYERRPGADKDPRRRASTT